MKNNKIILVPDIHQNIKWFKRILAKEGQDAHYVLMGDYFDKRGNEAEDSLELFCLGFGDALNTIDYEALIGNHDALYFERERDFDAENHIFSIYGIGNTIRRAQTIRKFMPGFLKSLKAYTYVGEYLVSHAGLNKLYLDNFDKINVILDKLYYNALTPLKENNILLAIGRDRGGEETAGGILWQDVMEFEDDLPCPQIFAHSRTEGGDPCQIGRSWMIDMAQTYYGIYDNQTKRLTFEKA